MSSRDSWVLELDHVVLQTENMTPSTIVGYMFLFSTK